jgi:hypothetical protein
MKTALILMTILGCDDTATQCHYIEMLDQRWTTIQECDASSEDKLRDFSNVPYPVVVAVCQTPEDSGLAELDPGDATAPVVAAGPASEVNGVTEIELPKADIPPPPATLPASTADADQDAEEGFASRVLARFKDALPEAETLKSLASEPVHVVSDGYSWVARRFD